MTNDGDETKDPVGASAVAGGVRPRSCRITSITPHPVDEGTGPYAFEPGPHNVWLWQWPNCPRAVYLKVPDDPSNYIVLYEDENGHLNTERRGEFRGIHRVNWQPL